jgi:hypothetical protein
MCNHYSVLDFTTIGIFKCKHFRIILLLQGNPVLIIGHHILHGEVVPMDKPFAILEQNQTSETAQLQDTVEYHIKAIVKRKLLFGDRPKPIIANVPKIV